MRDVYSQATTTQAWLGDLLSEKTSGVASRFVAAFERQNAHSMTRSFWNQDRRCPHPQLAEGEWRWAIMDYEKSNRLEDMPGLNDMITWIKQHLVVASNYDTPSALCEILTHPWWRRCWVTQVCVVGPGCLLAL